MGTCLFDELLGVEVETEAEAEVEFQHAFACKLLG